MNSHQQVLASASITKPGWVGTKDDLLDLIGFFEDVQNEIRSKVTNAHQREMQQLDTEYRARYGYLSGESLEERIKADIEENRQAKLAGVELDMKLTEELQLSAADPRQVIEAADLPLTKAFSLDLSTDYNSRGQDYECSVRLDVRAYGLDCTISARDRNFIEGTRARLDKVLERTKPPGRWMASPWFAVVATLVVGLTLAGSTLFVLSRLFPDPEGGIGGTALLVSVLIWLAWWFSSSFIWKRWTANFPTVEIIRDGAKPRAERATKKLLTGIGWALSVILVPIVLALILS